MDNEFIIKGLNKYRERLYNDVAVAYEQRGYSFGNERFDKWKEKFIEFLDKNLIGESNKFRK